MLLKILLTMIAFAANSVLCRVAITGGYIDEISFGSIRLISGALALYLFVGLRRGHHKIEYNPLNALLLSGYVFAFSLAYVSLNAATGALLLFGTVQLVMTGWGMLHGEKITRWKVIGILAALSGIGILLLPGATPPPAFAAVMMILSGVAWAAYCITGRAATSAASATAGNFILSVPVAVVAVAVHFHALQLDVTGLLLGIVAGAITSAGAYLLWYTLLPKLSSSTASTIQLSVPCLAALGGVLFMNEALDRQIVISTLIILSGIGLVIWSDKI